MVDEPETLMLRLLREIHAKQDDHDKRFDEHDKRFDRLERRHELTQYQVTHALGFAGMANLASQHTSASVAAIETWRHQLDTMMAKVKRRVDAMEAGLGL